MEVTCFENQTFYATIDKVVVRLKFNNGQHSENKWISPNEALKLLNTTHKTTLLRLRDAGKSGFTQPQKKIALCDSGFMIEYLNKTANNPFAK